MELTSGIYKLVTIPRFYTIFQNLLGGENSRRKLRERHFPDLSGKSILDIGCGPATWLNELKGYDSYLGIDWNKDHISHASRAYGSEQTQFECRDIAELRSSHEKYNYIFCFGILHHLDDQSADSILETCSHRLADNGTFISVDPVYHKNQNYIAKFVADRDSGQNIRNQTSYLALLETHFPIVESQLHTDLLRIPYSHFVMSARK